MILLSLKLLIRDWRAGELRLLLAALVIAVAALTTINFYIDRVTRGLELQAAELLGGDLVVSGSIAIPNQWVEQAEKLKLKTAQLISFPTVIVAGDHLQLANIKAVSDAYPLRGQLRSAQRQDMASMVATSIPLSGSVWMSAQLMNLLSVTVGEYVTIGSARFMVGGILVDEPDADSNWFNIAPHVLMNIADIEKTRTIQMGSRVVYRLLVAGNSDAIQQLKKNLKNKLLSGQKLLTIKDSQNQFKNILQRSSGYLNLAAIICVLLAGVAIATCARRYSEKHFDTCALLRCFGLTQQKIMILYGMQLLVLGIFGSGVGCVVGYLAQAGLANLFSGWLKIVLPPVSLFGLLLGFASGLLILIGFALPPFLKLKNIAPLRVLRREQLPLPISVLVVYGLAFVVIALLMLWYSTDFYLTLLVLYGIGLTAAGLYLASYGLLKLANLPRRYLGSAWRYGMANLVRRSHSSTVQLLAFGLVLMVMLLLTIVRNDLLSAWQKQVPIDAPNYFVINIQPSEVANFTQLLREHHITAAGIYPVVRGRLTALNSTPIMQAVLPAARSNNVLHRELNLTWTMQLPDDNRIEKGLWWTPSDQGKLLISVETKLASDLGLKLGDALTFQIGDQIITAKITSLRSLEWDSFHPNFYIIFPPAVLDKMPVSYMTSFYLAPEDKMFLSALIKNFPGVTLIDVDALLKQVRSVIAKVSIAVEYLLLFILCAGMIVLYAALQASRDERVYEGALLRTFGARTSYIRQAYLAEFLSLGMLAGLLAALGANLIAMVLAGRVFSLTYHINYEAFLIGTLSGGILVSVLGLLGTYRLLAQAPMQILREG